MMILTMTKKTTKLLDGGCTGREPETKHREDYGSGPEEMTDECFFYFVFL
jgi:hypothetical protein